MGQQQTKTNSTDYQQYTQAKPIHISQLQRYIDMDCYIKIENTSQLYSHYQLLLKSRQSEHYIYGVKLSNKLFFQQQNFTSQKIDDSVQIYVLQNQSIKTKTFLVFQGCLMRGKRTGFGVEYKENGDVFYQGTFKNSKYDGWGITQNYQGQWIEGTKCGYGVYKSNFNTPDKKNFIYEGMWKHDRFHGLGARNIKLSQTKLFLNPDYQQKSADIIDYQYIGEWVDGAKCGCGKLIKYTRHHNQVQKQIYEGQFAFNKYQGKGKRKLNNQTSFVEGIFQGGQFIKTT